VQIEATLVEDAVALPLASQPVLTISDRAVVGVQPPPGTPITFGTSDWGPPEENWTNCLVLLRREAQAPSSRNDDRVSAGGVGRGAGGGGGRFVDGGQSGRCRGRTEIVSGEPRAASANH